jgi:hypothetical protein
MHAWTNQLTKQGVVNQFWITTGPAQAGRLSVGLDGPSALCRAVLQYQRLICVACFFCRHVFHPFGNRWPKFVKIQCMKTHFSFAFICCQTTNNNHRNTKTLEVVSSPILLLQTWNWDNLYKRQFEKRWPTLANKSNREPVFIFFYHPWYSLKSLAGRTYPPTSSLGAIFEWSLWWNYLTNFLVHAPGLKEKRGSSATKTNQ